LGSARAMKNLIQNSIGSRLFFYVLGGALVGLGSMSYLFYQVLENRAKDEIQGNLRTQVSSIEGKLASAEQSMLSLVAAVKTMNQIGVKTPDAYEKMVLEILKQRSSLTMGVGFGQVPSKILPDRKLYWPYFFIDQKTPDQVGQPLPAPYSDIRQADVCTLDASCLTQEYYTLPIAAGKVIWMEPYEWSKVALTTTTAPILNEAKQPIGVVGLDINVTALTEEVKAPKSWGTGYFAILSEKGNLLAYPPNVSKAKALATYKDIPALNDVWQRLNEGEGGLFFASGQYWAYERVKGTNWIMLAAVPQSVVLVPVLSITLGGALGASMILALVVTLFVRRLNQRLRPILDECHKLAEMDTERSQRLKEDADQPHAPKISLAAVPEGDELELLTRSFHQMTTQLKNSFEELEVRVEERTADLKKAIAVADAANHAKSDFLANMSHELRTPLNGILGYAQILQRSPSLPDRDRRGVQIIDQCGSHLLTLINDVLDLSKIEAGKLELHPAPCHLPDVLQSVVEICRIKAEQKGLDFVYEPATGLPTGVLADEKRLRQVLINLLGNAVKFTDRGTVTLAVTPVEQGSDAKPQRKLRFQIQDTGVGMSTDQLQKIFTPFEQVGDTKKQSEGTGLGLSISQRIVALMGDEIRVRSELAVGSVFEFEAELPLAEAEAHITTIAPRQTITGYEGDRLTVLVVDDSWENRSVILHLLEPLGFTVVEAADGHEGLVQAHQHQPNLIVTDLAMPRMNGWEFMTELRQTDALKDTPIIVSSASVFELDRQKSIAAGGNDFLPKPLRAEELYAMVADHLNLQWIEQSDAPQNAPSAPMVIPPVTVLSGLLDCAKKGQIKGLRTELDAIAQLDPSYQSFVNYLSEAAQSFNIQKIRQFLQESIPTYNSVK
jgi:signal transduction histidine kinase/ActR/RegA family two-component response regulator